MKRLIIEQLKEGFNLIDEIGEKYATSDAMLSLKVKAYFGLTSHKPKKNIAPPVKVSDPKETRTQGSTTADSHSAGATSWSLSTEQVEFPAGNLPDTKAGKVETTEKPKLGTPDNILQPSDLKIAKFDFDLLAKMQKYKSLEFLELPDGRVVLKYGQAHYYTSKDAVLRIPFPFPKWYFDKRYGWSTSVEQAFKMYRRYLAEQKGHEGQPDGTCDDVSFDTCANNDPKICKFCVNESRYEDKRKLAARKPGALILKASMGV